MSTSNSSSTVVVFGATGNIGFGAATAFVKAGARVLAPTRSERGAQELQETFQGAVTPIIGDISDPAGAQVLVKQLLEHGPVEHVVASLGPWWQGGPLSGQTPQEWTKVRQMLLDGHVHAASLLLPSMSQHAGASYTIITGMGAHHTIPGTSLLYIAVNGVLALSKVAREEARQGVRVNELLIGGRVEKVARPGVIASAELGQELVALAHSDRRGEIVRFPKV